MTTRAWPLAVGRDEFTAMVGRITAIEQALGVYDLNQFTPAVTPYLPS